MNDLQSFTFEGNGVQTIQHDGFTWFKANSVTNILGISNTTQAIQRLDEDERSMFNIGRQGNTNFISEAGLYKLIGASRKPAAKKFNRWVTHEVLPSIRQNGSYTVQQQPQLPQSFAEALQLAADQAKQLEAQKPKVLFAESVATSNSTILVGDLAKIISGNGVSIGANRLFSWMRQNHYLISRRGSDWNMPTQRSMNMGLFQIKETVINRSDGSPTVSKTARVTGKGQQYFIKKFLGDFYPVGEE
ncbi:phage repressor protein/antirepressor Ant [Latilactobacillus curvatus]|uniref:phage antirepressor n=1 Tax=Latilactobacillus curvatus TaxID=28038 RepID=UPI00217E9522|nr:phage antirepressor KilAC domain-containing protein [Latilactobacillus curvatus]MCS6142269.1 phage repressor protein/antirepressor Ant [Latilactobacillus curvatus]